jgi:hypothetical protein
MRTMIIALFLGLGLAAVATAAASACHYNMTSASTDQATQTAQTQQLPDGASN